MSESLHLLLLEDEPFDAELTIAALEKAGYACRWERVQSRVEYLDCVQRAEYDLVLADYSMPGFDGLSALELLRERDSDLPFILVSGTVGEEIAIESLKAGATDYVLKDRLSRLVPAVQRALRERDGRRQRQRTERLLDALNRAALATSRAVTPAEIFTTVSETLGELGLSCMVLPTDDEQTVVYPTFLYLPSNLIRSAQDLTGLTQDRFAIQIDEVDAYRTAVREGKPVFVAQGEEPIRQALPGALKWLAGQLTRLLGYNKGIVAPMVIDDQIIGLLSVQGDNLVQGDVPAITAFAHQIAAAWHRALLFEQTQQELVRRRQAEEDRTLLATVIEQAAEIVVITDIEGTIQYVNPAFEQTTGYASKEAVGQNPRFLKSGRQGQDFYADLWQTITAGQVWHGRFVNKRKDGTLYTEEATVTPVRDDEGEIVNYVAVKRDVSDELELEERYRQSQKMEAIGRLAGGVAHDFNNLLTVIQGYTSFVLNELEPGDAMLEDLEEISRAGDRASALTSQLLAFSRRQVFQPKVVDLNLLIESSTKMLRRLIGEDIELRLATDAALGPVLADPGQIEQVIMNLSVNARDAMPQGGKLTFETANVSLDYAYAEVHPRVEPGDYVCLVVGDSGTGMTEKVKAHLFEPFFTTKGQGHGTGLGLATVWGLVEQSGGHIEVESELGVGTTFKIYLPRVDQNVEIERATCDSDNLPGGSETILLVEDEDPVRELTYRMLESYGYVVLEAGHPDQALRVSEQHKGDIDLLVSDVVMPGMGGPALAEQLTRSRPQLKVLYISGYTDDEIIRRGVVEQGIRLLQKPFAPDELARKVREALENPNST